MPHLPSRFAAVMLTFTPLFLRCSGRHAEVLPAGAILALGQRTVTSILCITGLAQERRFVNHHRVLNRVAHFNPFQSDISSSNTVALRQAVSSRKMFMPVTPLAQVSSSLISAVETSSFLR